MLEHDRYNTEETCTATREFNVYRAFSSKEEWSKHRGKLTH